jgi:uncharacterized protein involved in outer membrane biogenesis
MRRAWIIGASIVGVVVIAIIALFIWATLNLDSLIAAKRDYILSRASDALGRKIEIADIRASLGWGVSIDLRGVVIADDPAFSNRPMLTADNLNCRVELLPLLSHDVRISSVGLINPVVRIVRNSAGKLNILTLGKGASSVTHNRSDSPGDGRLAADRGAGSHDSSSQSPLESAPAATTKTTNSILSSLYIRDLTITNGTVFYSVANSGGEPLAIKDLDLSVSNFSVDAPFNLQLAFAIFGTVQNVNVAGRVGPLLRGAKIDPMAVPVAMTIKMGPVNLANLRTIPSLTNALPSGLSIDGGIAATGSASGTPAHMSVSLAADLTSNRVSYGSLFNKVAGTPFSIDASGTVAGANLTVNRSTVKLASLTLEISGMTVNNGRIGAQVSSNRFDLGPFASLIPPLERFKTSGAAQLRARVESGGGQKPQINGVLALSNVALSPGGKLPALAGLTGEVKMAGNSFDAGPLSFAFGGGHSRLTVHAQSIQPLAATYAFDADVIKPAVLMPSRPAEESLNNIRLNGTASGTPAALSVAANLASSSGLINRVAYSNLALIARLANKLLTVESLRVGAFDGTISAAARADLTSTPKFNVNADLNHIDAQAAISSQNPKAAAIVRGLVSGTATVAGAGNNFEQIKPTLRGNGRIALLNGKLIGVNVVASALAKIDNIPGIGALIPMNVVASHPELFKNPNTDIDSATMSFVLAGPRLTTNDLTVNSTDYRILGQGWFDMDKNIDLAAHILLSQPFSAEIRAAKKNVVYLENQSGQIDVPLRISGRLPKPTIAPDVGDIARRAASQAIKQRGEKLLNKLGGFLGGRGGGSGGSQPSGGGGTSNPLKNLF